MHPGATGGSARDALLALADRLRREAHADQGLGLVDVADPIAELGALAVPGATAERAEMRLTTSPPS
jgi:hypothetical protein